MDSAPCNREEIESLGDAKPTRGVQCPKCNCHIPEFAELDAETTAKLKRMHAGRGMLELRRLTGCSPTWRKFGIYTVMVRIANLVTGTHQIALTVANNFAPNSPNNASLAVLIGIENVLPLHRVVQHGFYARPRLRLWSIVWFTGSFAPLSRFGLPRRGHRLFGNVISFW